MLIRGSNPIWYEVDLAANAFDDNFYLYVLENDLPYIPATVYKDPYSNVAWRNPIQFLGNGTLPNNIYFDPNTVYRLEFRQNNGIVPPSQQDPLIYLVENYDPGSGGSTPSDTVSFSTDNQITNPQFALINFGTPSSPTFTYTGSASSLPSPINFAPGWFLNLVGTGTVTLTQVPINSTVNPNPTNASYALQIQLSGSWTGAYLSQRFAANGVQWAGTYVSTQIMGLTGFAPENISSILIDSQGNTTPLLPTTALTEAFNSYPNVTLLGASADTDLPPTAYTEYRIILPYPFCNITLSSIQLVSGDVDVAYPYEQTTIERQIDHTFHVAQPALNFKPIKSWLVGWDFPLNPAQFNGRSVGAQAIGANTGFYAWDQTIVFQSVTNSVGVSGDTANNLKLTPTTTTQIGLIQYLNGAVVNDMLNQSMSVNVRALSAANINATVSLWYTSNANVPTLPATFISTLDANGHPQSVVSGWTEVPKQNTNTGKITISASSDFIDIPLSYWDLDDQTLSQSATFFAISICTASITNTNNITFSSISCIPGQIATRPSPQTLSEVLNDCQYFYQKSFVQGLVPATNVGFGNGETWFIQNTGATTAGAILPVRFVTPMRVSPTVTLYNPAATNNFIRNVSVSADFSVSTPDQVNTNGFYAGGTTPGSGSQIGNLIAVNWTANALLGSV